jgi:hypothetical protein
VFALYVMLYTLGRGWIEYLRIDPVELQNVGGLRFNVWTSIVLFVLATAYFVVATRRHPRPDSREPSPYRPGHGVGDPAEDAGNGTENGPEDASVRPDETEDADLSGRDRSGPEGSARE